MDKHQVIEQMIELSHPQTEESWLSAAELGLEHNITVPDMVAYVDYREPTSLEDWTIRAELFETMLYLSNAMNIIKEK